jgi:hypothetical protein
LWLFHLVVVPSCGCSIPSSVLRQIRTQTAGALPSGDAHPRSTEPPSSSTVS